MMRLIASLHILTLNLNDRLDALGRDERGEHNTASAIGWVLAAIAMVALAVTAIRAYLDAQIGKLG